MDEAEITPGALGRMTLHDHPVGVAAALAQWFGEDLESQETAATWFAAVAAELRSAHNRGA